MAYNFLACDRDQAFLLPPDLREWLPADHLAWFILDVVDQLNLGPFLAAYRADGHGRAAYEPRMLLGVLLYAYCTGVRSSRQIERRCHEDLAFRVLAGNTQPDHVTIVRFRVRHEQALAGLLVASLRLCAAAGMVCLGADRAGWHQDRGQRRRGGQPHPRPPRGPGRRAAPAGCRGGSGRGPRARRCPRCCAAAGVGRPGRAAGPVAAGQGPAGG
jgi:transposase